MSKFLVTGGCGFIGSHLVDTLLAAGHQIIVLDDLSSGKTTNLSSSATLVQGSICDTTLVNELFKDIDGCFHLAAIASITKSVQDWLYSHQVNLTGTITVFNAARLARPHKPIPIVYTSSSAVYGNVQTLPLDEASMPVPINSYGADKLGAEHHAKVAGLVYQVPTFGLRLFNVYGQRQDPCSPYSGVISIFIEKFKQQQPLTIYGDGKQTRDFVYVNDVIDALIAAMQRTNVTAPIANIGTGISTNLLNLVDQLSLLFNQPAEISFAPSRPGDIVHSVANIALAQQLLNYQPQFNLTKGLADLLQLNP